MYKCRYNEITDKKYLWEFAEISVTLVFQIFFFKNAKNKTKQKNQHPLFLIRLMEILQFASYLQIYKIYVS